MEVNSYVVINEDIKKIIYIIDSIDGDKLYLCGLNYRIRKIVLVGQVRLATIEEVNREIKEANDYFLKVSNTNYRNDKNYLLGKILHLDGDKKYLSKCLELYKSIGVYADGFEIDEELMPSKIKYLLNKLNPDILVITGHDLYNQKGVKHLENYKNTSYFIETIQNARKLKGKHDLVIVAGACQSNYEALIANGADFASSPKRINIHTFDPAVIAIKTATTSITRIVNLSEALRYIDRGQDAFGGLETFGRMRLFV